MPDSVSQAQRQRRANWVALRTLRQLPKAAGQTTSGDPVFEVRSVRVVLRGDAGHFNRLVHCSRCRREVVGSPILSPDDLERASSPVICQVCVKGSGLAVSWSPEERRSAPTPPAEEAPAPVEVLPVADDRGEQLEAQLEAVVGRLAEVVEAVERRPTDEAVQAAVQAAVAEAMAGRLAGMDEEVRQGLSSLVKSVDAQRAELSALAGSVAETRAEVERLAETSRVVAKAHETLDERVSEMAARPATSATEVAAREALERRVDEVHAELTVLIQGGLSRAGAEASEREQQVQHGMSRLSAMIAELRREVQASTEAAGRLDLAPLDQAQKELAAAQTGLDQRLHDVEQRVQEAIRHLAARLDRATAPAPAVATPAGSLLDTLDAQLRAAEDRLAERAAVRQVELLIEPAEADDRPRAGDRGWLVDPDRSGVAAPPVEPVSQEGNGHGSSSP